MARRTLCNKKNTEENAVLASGVRLSSSDVFVRNKLGVFSYVINVTCWLEKLT